MCSAQESERPEGSSGVEAVPKRASWAGSRPLGSFQALKTVDWHRLDAALAGSWSYFGAPVPGKKSDFLHPGTDFWPTGPALAGRLGRPSPRQPPRVFWAGRLPEGVFLTIYRVLVPKCTKMLHLVVFLAHEWVPGPRRRAPERRSGWSPDVAQLSGAETVD